MGYQIIRQPDGRYALFCNITDTIARWNATEDDVVAWFVDEAAEKARHWTRFLLGHIAAGQPERAYHQYALSWDDVLTLDRENGGEAWQKLTGQAQDLGGAGG